MVFSRVRIPHGVVWGDIEDEGSEILETGAWDKQNWSSQPGACSMLLQIALRHKYINDISPKGYVCERPTNNVTSENNNPNPELRLPRKVSLLGRFNEVTPQTNITRQAR